MFEYDQNEIERLAFGLGRDASYAYFLKSEAVARRVADEILSFLADNGIDVRGRRNVVTAVPNQRWAGTYHVCVSLPGVTRGTKREAAVKQLVHQALRTVVKPSDRVTTWREPR